MPVHSAFYGADAGLAKTYINVVFTVADLVVLADSLFAKDAHKVRYIVGERDHDELR